MGRKDRKYVYFVGYSGQNKSRIRIGIATQESMDWRISKLEQEDPFTKQPNPNLWYLGKFEGTKEDVQEIKNKFEHLHIRWDWYKWTTELREHIRDKAHAWRKETAARLEVANLITETLEEE